MLAARVTPRVSHQSLGESPDAAAPNFPRLRSPRPGQRFWRYSRSGRLAERLRRPITPANRLRVRSAVRCVDGACLARIVDRSAYISSALYPGNPRCATGVSRHDHGAGGSARHGCSGSCCPRAGVYVRRPTPRRCGRPRVGETVVRAGRGMIARGRPVAVIPAETDFGISIVGRDNRCLAYGIIESYGGPDCCRSGCVLGYTSGCGGIISPVMFLTDPGWRVSVLGSK